MRVTKRFNFMLRGVLLVGILISLLIFWQNSFKAEAADHPVTSQTTEPLFMVPGTGADVDRFDELIDQLKQNYNDVSVVKIQVNTDSTLKISGRIDQSSRHQIVVVGFEDSSDATLPKQGAWFQKALQFMQKQYQFSKFDYLGHSNGGLVITQYLEEDAVASDPKLATLITLGTPYNDVPWKYNEEATTFSTAKKVSEQLSGYLATKENIPTDITMINVVGKVEDSTSDNVVPMTSVLAGRLLYGASANYQELILTEDADHSALVENKAVQGLLTDILW